MAGLQHTMKKSNQQSGKPLNAGGRRKISTRAANKNRARSSIGSRTIVVKHAEQIGAYTTTSADFTVLDTFDLLPTDTLTFPWLSGIAARYERYRFLKCSFRLSTSAPSTASGMVTLCFDYDYADPIPVAERDMTLCENWCQVSVREDTKLALIPSRLSDLRYCDDRGGDSRLSYAGFATLATRGVNPSYTVSVWIDYLIELVSPSIPTTLAVYAPDSEIESHTLALGTDPWMSVLDSVLATRSPASTALSAVASVSQYLSGKPSAAKFELRPGSHRIGFHVPFAPDTPDLTVPLLDWANIIPSAATVAGVTSNAPIITPSGLATDDTGDDVIWFPGWFPNRADPPAADPTRGSLFDVSYGFNVPTSVERGYVIFTPSGAFNNVAAKLLAGAAVSFATLQNGRYISQLVTSRPPCNPLPAPTTGSAPSKLKKKV